MTEFKTPDLYMAAMLITVGVPFLRLDKVGQRGFFVFDAQAEDFEDLKHGWFSGSMEVSALEYASKIKHLKNLVMNF